MSPSRDFRDDSGRTWTAWDVVPSWGERRISNRRHRTEGAPSGSDERRQAERRRRRGIRVGLPATLAHGWLAFACDRERRRIAPIPSDWDGLAEEQLRALWQSAERLPDRRRRLIE